MIHTTTIIYKVNLNKTEAFPLSGSPSVYHSLWRSPLLSNRIYSWNDRTSDSPVVYLGFPLHLTVSQRNQFLDTLFKGIESSYRIHSQRSLSIRGRITIVNSLILSRLWHVLRVLSVPKRFLHRVRSAVSSFVNHRAFPKISFSSLRQPRQYRGLGLLDRHIQQGVLQLRWLLPLLQSCPLHDHPALWSQPSIQSSFVIARLTNWFFYYCQQSFPTTPTNCDYRLHLLFGPHRPAAAKHIDSAFSLLFRAIDLLPRSFSSVVISKNTALCLPLSAVALPSDTFHLSRTTAGLPSSMAYIIDPTNNRLRPKTHEELLTHPRLCRQFLKHVSKDELKLVPFFIRSLLPAFAASQAVHPYVPVTHDRIDASPFVEALALLPSPARPIITPKHFRQLCLQHDKLSSSHPQLSPRSWKSFWSFPLPHPSRTVWFLAVMF
ncbi:hypothetical protein G6F52_007555 [Rhizopus delemar]|nr:hypothetical protein G6F52_007555 [Rhizopus delemar]